MPGLFKMCASCLGYDALDKERSGGNGGTGKRRAVESEETASMIFREEEDARKETEVAKKTAGILKKTKKADPFEDDDGVQIPMAAENVDEDSGACVDEASRNADGGGESATNATTATVTTPATNTTTPLPTPVQETSTKETTATEKDSGEPSIDQSIPAARRSSLTRKFIPAVRTQSYSER